MSLPTLSRQEIEYIKRDLRDTMKASRDLNINMVSLIRQKVLLQPKEQQQLYWDIFLYLLEQDNAKNNT